MVERRFPPGEIDQIEDALEHLEDRGLPRDVSPEVQAELAAHRELLQMSRDALPLVDPPSHVLDQVMQAAREGLSDDAEVSEPTPSRAPSPSRWARWRRQWMLPGLAFAGTAAIILLWVRPTADQAEPTAHFTARQAVPEPPASQAPAAPAASPPATLRPAEEAEARFFDAPEAAPRDAEVKDAAAPREPDPVQAEEAAPAKSGKRAPSRRKDAKRSAKGRGSPTAPTSKPEVLPTSGSASTAPEAVDDSIVADEEAKLEQQVDEQPQDAGLDDALARLDRADALRVEGRCDEALPLYRALREASEANIRERAGQGIEACTSRAKPDDAPSE